MHAFGSYLHHVAADDNLHVEASPASCPSCKGNECSIMSKLRTHLQMQEGGVVQLCPCAVTQVVREAVPADGLAAALLQQTVRTGNETRQGYTHASTK
jgi:hypothetical protein